MSGGFEFTIEDYNPREDFLTRRTTVDDESGCWLWTSTIDRDGYGRASYHGSSVAAHRLSYETRVGPIPAGLELDHTCERRDCVRPDHLEPVTTLENRVRHHTRRGVPRAEAEVLAAEYLEQHERKRDVKRYANEQVSAAGIRKGMLVRDGRKLAVWTVVRWWAMAVGSPVIVGLRQGDEDSALHTVKLSRLRAVD
ncbi:HNH endonuclease signature motif containing protein [Leifsonia sp. EB34]|uniref:HNH endonuclease signature motif containing protein n=1 Tax=Leifsonia sp. EB34 TaxID=3156303 RepID=UPI003512D353